MNITRTSYRINTLKPDGNPISISADYTDPADYDRAAIAELKEFQSVYTLQAGENFLNKTIYITGGTLNIGNVYPSGTPASGYRFSITGATSNAVVYNVPYIGCSNNGAQNEVFKCTVEFTNLGQTILAQTVTVKIQQILSFDIENYRACDFYDNQARLLRSLHNETTTLPTSADADSYYNNSQKMITSVFHVTQGTDFYRDEIQVPFQAAWYNKGLLDAAPYFSAPTVSLEVNGITATGLSPVKNTKVALSNSCPVQPDYLIVTLIDVTNNNQALAWWENYDLSAAEILTVVGAGAISGYNSKFMSPSQVMTLVSGSTYEAFFEIDYSQLTPGNKYRIIWTLYNLDPYYLIDDEVNTFISEEFTADFYEPFNGEEFELEGILSDYQRNFYGNFLTVVPEERIKAQISLDYWDGTNNSLNDRLVSRFGALPTAIPGDIRSSLKEVQIVVAFDETIAGDLYTHILQDIKILRTGINTYLLPDGTEFEATGDDTSFPAFEQSCLLAYTFRVRYEDDIPNLYSYINGVLQPAPLSNQNWIGRTVGINWRLTFEYELTSPVQSDLVTFQQRIFVNQYENDKDLADVFLDFIAEPSEEIVVCTGDDSCFETELITAPPIDIYKHIVNIDRHSHKVQNIEEEEVWIGVLPTETTDKLTNVDEEYDPYVWSASFCVDQDNIELNRRYKISAIAKKALPCENPIIIGIHSDFISYGGAQNVELVIKTPVGKNLLINWGDETSTVMTGNGALQTFPHQYTINAETEITICGDIGFISDFFVTDQEGVTITFIEAEHLGEDIASITEFYVFGDLYSYVRIPTNPTYSKISIFGGTGLNPNVIKLNLSTILAVTGRIDIAALTSLSSLFLNPSLSLNGLFLINDTALDEIWPLGTDILVTGVFNPILKYRNNLIPNVMSQATLDGNIHQIYINRANFNNASDKKAWFDGNNPAPTGTYQAPAGYIQADAVTVGNDGTPANANEEIYVLENQNNDNTVVKKYKWTITNN